ncbi:TPA: DUF4238 domain-containing protein [Legionella anisa]|uniref:DUF4238 domain-containing protein n=2 Tax=Legionella anisa TaxID=28082 RepID=A0AAX0WWV0_9GAMM|nr:DUF4238 domain-containing protein [Legionella anisa]AWN73448.1 DUF4238 domain-containing protein [Legionella anisa]PNL62640.1 DUF4238 domain-containing protein [Legionella anisa]UAK78611.1 DUF4238 domain-containing protein [Legionella anisa]
MRHHYIPKFYLKNWESSLGIFCYFYEYHKFLMTNKKASEVGFLHNLNSFVTTEGILDHTIESEHLSVHDNSSAIILQKIIDFGISSIDFKEQEDWCDFILALFLRHPYIMNEARNDIESSIKEFEMHLNATLIESEEYKHFYNNYHIENMKNDIKNQRSALKSLMLELNWFLLDFKSSTYDLLTGDMPVSIYNLNDKIITAFDDINDSSIFLTFPLTPKKCFIATKSKKNLDNFIFPMRRLIRDLNLKMVEKSVFYVFSNTNHPYNFIKKHMNDTTDVKRIWQERLKR